MNSPLSFRNRPPRNRHIVVAGAQFAVVPNDISSNLYRCIYFLRRAKEDTGARLLVFPESITTGFNPAMDARELYDMLPDTDDMLSPVQRACRDLRIHCVLPTYERGSEPGVVYNSAFLIDSRGRNLGAYRKTHLFPTERIGNKGWTTPGNDYPVFETEIGTIGIHICYDGDFPEISRILAVKGAQIICRPSALLRNFEIWEASNKMRAYENHVHHIAVNAIGSDAAHTTYFGHSMIVSPVAQTLALARAVDDLIYAELDPDPFHRISYGSDAPMLFDHLEDRNVASYTQDLFTPARVATHPAMRKLTRK
ncbi:MAG: carbon-nitrogen hydrolase family protein [Lentisphaerae bacterium]|nr:carbon-nitrogen hydrolase family protein [Lentisphaerota bacterium]